MGSVRDEWAAGASARQVRRWVWRGDRAEAVLPGCAGGTVRRRRPGRRVEVPFLRPGVQGERQPRRRRRPVEAVRAHAGESTLLIVSDPRRFQIRTNRTMLRGQDTRVRTGRLADASVRNKVRWAMSDPGRLRPGETRRKLTERAAGALTQLGRSLRDGGHARTRRLTSSTASCPACTSRMWDRSPAPSVQWLLSGGDIHGLPSCPGRATLRRLIE